MNKENTDDDTFQESLRRAELQIMEGDLWYAPDPDLTEIKCDFKHKKCKNPPTYMDKRDNCHYCWLHRIMIRRDEYK